MDALPYTMNVSRICGVPERRGMALVGFGCKEKLEGNVGGRRGVVQESVRLVMAGDGRAYAFGPLFYTLSNMYAQERPWCSRCCL